MHEFRVFIVVRDKQTNQLVIFTSKTNLLSNLFSLIASVLKEHNGIKTFHIKNHLMRFNE